MHKDLNKARVLFRHDGHESYAQLLIGGVCIPVHCYDCMDLNPKEMQEEKNGSLWIYLNLEVTEIKSYQSNEEDPFFGSLKTNWSNHTMIGKLSFHYSVSVRNPDSLTMSPYSMVDYRDNVIVEGTGKIVGFTDDDNAPIVVSCGLFFSLYFTMYLPDKATFIPKIDEDVLFKGYLHCYAA